MTTLQMMARRIDEVAEHAARERWKYRRQSLGKFLKESDISKESAAAMLEDLDGEVSYAPGEFVEEVKRQVIDRMITGR